jgi:hypothetical protein
MNMKLVLTLLVVCYSNLLSAQTIPVDSSGGKSVQELAAMHLEKKKDKQTVAFILLSGGTILLATSAFTISNSPLLFGSDEDERRVNGAIIRGLFGLGAVVACIPFFASATTHKKKAAWLLKNETVFLPDPSKRASFTAMGISIRL